MPNWLIALFIRIAVAVGIPYLMKKFPGLPSDIWKLIEEILKHIQGSPQKKEEVKKIRKAVRECTGVACPSELKHE